MSNSSDFYEILGVKKDADFDTIKKAYRNLAKKYHPDHNQHDKDSEDKFKSIQEAYDVLSDQEKRSRYDRGQNPHAKSNIGFDPFSTNDFFDFSDFFNFQSKRHTAKDLRGVDTQWMIDLSIEEVVSGCNKDIEIPWNDNCSECSGSGLKKGKSINKCEHCHGKGRISDARQTHNGGFVTTITVCPKCKGVGEKINPEDQCPSCHGRGLIDSTKVVNVSVPIGVMQNITIQAGQHGLLSKPSGKRGNLNIGIRIKPHELFKISGSDIHLKYPVTLAEAISGTTLTVPTIFGSHDVKMEPGTQNGRIYTIYGKGIPVYGQQKGNMIVEVYCEIPSSLDDLDDKISNINLDNPKINKILPDTCRIREKFKRYIEKEKIK